MTYRLSSNMPNESRFHKQEQLKQKYFFVVEGSKTEVIYFKALGRSISKASLTEVLVLERIKATESNQLKITEAIEKYIQQSKIINTEQKSSLDDLLFKLEEEKLNEKEAIECLYEIIGSKTEDLFVSELGNIKEQLDALRTLYSYSEDLDHICIIIDRDPQSFKEDQFDKVIHICEENDFLLGITNPNFEFYLLLHLTDALELDKDGLKRNYNVSRKYKYVQKQLSEYMQYEGETYRKGEYSAAFFLERFSMFEKNITQYQDKNTLLKNEIGSSLHHIINRIF